MEINEVVNILNANIVCGATYLDKDVEFGFASDLMSDVLTLDAENILLITGLSNMQTVRTVEMSDIYIVILARGKKASKEMIELANESGMMIIECEYSMFKTAGLLYEAGLKAVY
ncbi:MAG: hypothetical protein DRJ01_10895 [Bacteroidetes bacterium]|nr:MAG: hypothetical protein DRJ01_10895 [Bacteroidota bacterium]